MAENTTKYFLEKCYNNTCFNFLKSKYGVLAAIYQKNLSLLGKKNKKRCLSFVIQYYHGNNIDILLC